MALSAAAASIIAGSVAAAGQASSAAAQGKMNKRTREFNREEAEKARDWQAEMSGTAFQRSAADMKAAGLNPILMYGDGGPASVGGASAASVGNQQAPDFDFSNVMSSAMETKMAVQNQKILDQQLANLKKDEENKAKDVDLKTAQIMKTYSEAGLVDENAFRLHSTRDLFKLTSDIDRFKNRKDIDSGLWRVDYFNSKLKSMTQKERMAILGIMLGTTAYQGYTGFLDKYFNKNVKHYDGLEHGEVVKGKQHTYKNLDDALGD